MQPTGLRVLGLAHKGGAAVQICTGRALQVESRTGTVRRGVGEACHWQSWVEAWTEDPQERCTSLAGAEEGLK